MNVPIRHVLHFISLLCSPMYGSVMHLWTHLTVTSKDICIHLQLQEHKASQKYPVKSWRLDNERSEREKWVQGLPHTEGGGANMGLFCPKNGPIFHLAESTTIFQMVHTRHTHIPPPSPGPSCRRNVPKILLKNLL